MTTTEVFILYVAPVIAGVAALALYALTSVMDRRDRAWLRRQQDARRDAFREALGRG